MTIREFIVHEMTIKWDTRIENLIIKMRKLSYFYINAKKLLDKPMLRMVCLGWTIEIVAYNKIQTAQKSIIKIIFYRPRTYPSEHFYKEIKLFNIKQLSYKKALYFSYKMNFIECKKISHITRQNNNFTIPAIKKLKSIRYVGKVGLLTKPSKISHSIL